MAAYEILFARTARKELEDIEVRFAVQILKKIEGLSLNPRPTGSKKLKGEKNLWRLRVGNYRVIYSISDSDKLIDVSVIRHRKDVYK
ncbi:MAG: type II toxin-antitoxin system RelE/ParE family toxin [Ignavibacteria bacterium]|nr:type II toxin-antitoxin system RelE/ParE family toxin [Ignavibacteria bacterium]